MGKQEGCIRLSACDSETLRRNSKGSKQNRAREARLLNTKAGGLPSIHELMEKIVLRVCPKGWTSVYNTKICNHKFLLGIAMKM